MAAWFIPLIAAAISAAGSAAGSNSAAVGGSRVNPDRNASNTNFQLPENISPNMGAYSLLGSRPGLSQMLMGQGSAPQYGSTVSPEQFTPQMQTPRKMDLPEAKAGGGMFGGK